jgi:hypothetical protein
MRRRLSFLLATPAILAASCGANPPPRPAGPQDVPARIRDRICPWDPVRPGQPQFHVWTLIGLKEDDAQRRARQFGCSIRVVNDGENLTGEISTNRIDVDTHDGYVSAIADS